MDLADPVVTRGLARSGPLLEGRAPLALFTDACLTWFTPASHRLHGAASLVLPVIHLTKPKPREIRTVAQPKLRPVGVLRPRPQPRSLSRQSRPTRR